MKIETMAISWKLITDFDKQNHLFFEKIKMGYVVEVSICTCGFDEFIVKYPEQELNYTCPQCKNEIYHDAHGVWKNLDNFLPKKMHSKLQCQYDIYYNSSHITSRYCMSIPIDVDFLNKKVIWAQKPICSLSITSNGEIIKKHIIKPQKEIYEQLEKRIIQQINKNNPLRAAHSINEVWDLKRVSFILKHKALRGIEFYHWEDISIFTKDIDIEGVLAIISNFRKEKSVKKAVYQNYIEQMKGEDMFDDFFIELFTRKIEDPNILVKCLNLQRELKLLSCPSWHLFIDFLKLHYSEKQIFKLISEASATRENSYLFVNTIVEFHSYIERYEFRKVPCKIRALHDELTRDIRKDKYKDIFYQELAYTDEELKSCTQVDEYHIQLPHTGKDLYDWADIVHSPLASHFYQMQEKKTIIYGFFKKEILQFTIRMEDRDIIEIKRKYQTCLNDQEYKVLSKWFENTHKSA
jgi:hypothetical protein